MTETFIELTEDEFDGQYSPIPNHINPSAGWAYGESGGCEIVEDVAFERV